MLQNGSFCYHLNENVLIQYQMLPKCYLLMLSQNLFKGLQSKIIRSKKDPGQLCWANLNPSQQNNIMSKQSPQKASRSLPPLPKQHSYIERTLDLLESGCIKEGTLNIDGDIGDYRMRLFRNKDRKDYAKNIHSVFTNSFTDSILPKEAHNKDVRELITGIVKQPYRNTITPQPETKLTISVQETQGPKLGKGDIHGVMEEEGQLLYKYLPEYQRRRWFEVKDRSPLLPLVEDKAESVLSNKKSFSLSKKSNKIRHIFAYLENPIYLRTIK